MKVHQTVQAILEGGKKANLAKKRTFPSKIKPEDYKQGVNKRINLNEVITNRDGQIIRKSRVTVKCYAQER